MIQSPTLLELLQAGVHFGHRVSRWHPKMKPFIFTTRGGIHIINLEETVKKLEEALEFVRRIGERGGIIVFVGTKRQARAAVERAAQQCSMPWVTTRWLGGTFTNYSTIRRLIDQYLAYKQDIATDALEKYTKKERLMIQRKVAKMEDIVGGLAALRAIPDAIIVVDAKKEKTAVAEARATGVAIVALCDTNTNPDELTYPIPANDDAVRSIELITRLIAEAYCEGRENAQAREHTSDVVSDETTTAVVANPA